MYASILVGVEPGAHAARAARAAEAKVQRPWCLPCEWRTLNLMTAIVMASGMESLRHRILQRIAPVLRAAEVKKHEVDCELRDSISDLHVLLRGPARTASVEQALGVRVHDTIRADGRTFGPVNVRCSFGDADGPR